MDRDKQRVLEGNLEAIADILIDNQLLSDDDTSESVRNYIDYCYRNLDKINPEELYVLLEDLLREQLEHRIKERYEKR